MKHIIQILCLTLFGILSAQASDLKKSAEITYQNAIKYHAFHLAAQFLTAKDVANMIQTSHTSCEQKDDWLRSAQFIFNAQDEKQYDQAVRLVKAGGRSFHVKGNPIPFFLSLYEHNAKSLKSSEKTTCIRHLTLENLPPMTATALCRDDGASPFKKLVTLSLCGVSQNAHDGVVGLINHAQELKSLSLHLTFRPNDILRRMTIPVRLKMLSLTQPRPFQEEDLKRFRQDFCDEFFQKHFREIPQVIVDFRRALSGLEDLRPLRETYLQDFCFRDAKYLTVLPELAQKNDELKFELDRLLPRGYGPLSDSRHLPKVAQLLRGSGQEIVTMSLPILSGCLLGYGAYSITPERPTMQFFTTSFALGQGLKLIDDYHMIREGDGQLVRQRYADIGKSLFTVWVVAELCYILYQLAMG